MEFSGNSEASGLRRNRESSSPCATSSTWWQEIRRSHTDVTDSTEPPRRITSLKFITNSLRMMTMNPIWHNWWTRSQKSAEWSRGTPKSKNCCKDKFPFSKDNEFEHLPLNHIRRLQNKITEEEKLQFFTSLSNEDAIDFWQTVWVTSDTTLRGVPQMFRKEYSPDGFKEVSRYQWD